MCVGVDPCAGVCAGMGVGIGVGLCVCFTDGIKSPLQPARVAGSFWKASAHSAIVELVWAQSDAYSQRLLGR